MHQAATARVKVKVGGRERKSRTDSYLFALFAVFCVVCNVLQ